MPRSDWGIVAALIGCLALAWLALSDAHYREYQASAPDSHSERVNQIETARSGIPFPAERFTSNPEPKSTDEREKRDLAAQEASAAWGFWVALFAGVQLIATIIGLYYIKGTLDATQRAVEDTGKATRAMERQNTLAEHQQRPWVTIAISEPYICRSRDGILLVFSVDLGNIGGTPAFNAAVDHALGPGVRNPIYDFQIIAENVTVDEEHEWESLIILPNGTAKSQIFIDLKPDDPRHPFDDGVVPTFMIWANYTLPNGNRAHSSAWFTVIPKASTDIHAPMFYWDEDRTESGEGELQIQSHGYVRVT